MHSYGLCGELINPGMLALMPTLKGRFLTNVLRGHVSDMHKAKAAGVNAGPDPPNPTLELPLLAFVSITISARFAVALLACTSKI